MKRVSTGIYRHKYRTGEYFWMVRWWDEKEAKWRAVKGGETEDEAKIIEGELRQDLLRGIDPLLGRQKRAQGEGNETISDMIEVFYNTPSFSMRSPHWRRTIRCQIETHIRKQLGKVRCRELNKDRIFGFYMVLKKKNLANATIKKYHYTLGQILDLYVERYPLIPNPVRQIKDFRKNFPRQAPTRDINFLVPSEIEAILKQAKKSRNRFLYPFLKLIAFSGMRRTEAMNLKWTDVDMKTGFIYVRNSKNGESRTIPIEPEVYEVLDSLDRRTTYLFSHKGKKMGRDLFLKPLKVAVKHAGIRKRIDLHSFRRSYGSNKIRQGWGLKKVSMLLGHKSITMTSEVYTHHLRW